MTREPAVDRPPHLHLAPAAPDPSLPADGSGPELPARAEARVGPHLVPIATPVDAAEVEPGAPSLGVTMLPLPCPQWCDRHRETAPGWVVHEGVEKVIDGDYGRPLVRLRPVMGMACGEDTPPVVSVVWSGGRDRELSVSEVRRLADALHRRADALDGYPRP